MSKNSFGHLGALFAVSALDKVDKRLASVVFSSPLSARSPDLCMLWHDGYRENNSLKLIFGLLFKVLLSFVRGATKQFLESKLSYALYGKVSDSLLVLSSTCGSRRKDSFYKTPYVETEKDDALFVFGFSGTCSLEETAVNNLSFKKKLLFTLSLAYAGVYSFFKIEGKLIDRLLLCLEWLRWSLSLNWLYAYYLEQELSDLVEKCSVKKIGCIHEMHFYSRIVWQVAYCHNAQTYTVQHAAITPGKMWYFSFPEEISSGLKLPDVMHVFNEEVIRLLKPYYPNTKFVLGCSNRYAHWRNVVNSENKENYYLFVSALAEFDNHILIKVLRRLVERSKSSMSVRLRFHPYAQIRRKDKKWIRDNLEQGLIDVSKGTPLKDDIKGAIAVVGMSTTVLEEALLMGCPVVQITDPDFLQYINVSGIKGATNKDHRELLPVDLESSAGRRVDSATVKERLGISQPLVTYKQLFS